MRAHVSASKALSTSDVPRRRCIRRCQPWRSGLAFRSPACRPDRRCSGSPKTAAVANPQRIHNGGDCRHSALQPPGCGDSLPHWWCCSRRPAGRPHGRRIYWWPLPPIREPASAKRCSAA